MFKGLWVVILGGAVIGAGLGAAGLNITMPLWWYIDIPLVVILNWFRNDISDFFSFSYFTKKSEQDIRDEVEEEFKKHFQEEKNLKKYI
jgi:hypothetical protein